MEKIQRRKLKILAKITLLLLILPTTQRDQDEVSDTDTSTLTNVKDPESITKGEIDSPTSIDSSKQIVSASSLPFSGLKKSTLEKILDEHIALKCFIWNEETEYFISVFHHPSTSLGFTTVYVHKLTTLTSRYLEFRLKQISSIGEAELIADETKLKVVLIFGTCESSQCLIGIKITDGIPTIHFQVKVENLPEDLQDIAQKSTNTVLLFSPSQNKIFSFDLTNFIKPSSSSDSDSSGTIGTAGGGDKGDLTLEDKKRRLLIDLQTLAKLLFLNPTEIISPNSIFLISNQNINETELPPAATLHSAYGLAQYIIMHKKDKEYLLPCLYYQEVKSVQKEDIKSNAIKLFKCFEKKYSLQTLTKIIKSPQKIIIIDKEKKIIDSYLPDGTLEKSYRFDLGINEDTSIDFKDISDIALFPSSNDLSFISIDNKILLRRTSTAEIYQEIKLSGVTQTTVSAESICVSEDGLIIAGVFKEETQRTLVTLKQPAPCSNDENCQLCFYDGSLASTGCVYCKQPISYKLKQYQAGKGGTCQTTCTNNEKFIASEICSDPLEVCLNKDCALCDNEGNCKICIENHFLTAEKTCKTSCPEKFFKDSASIPHICSPCVQNCKKCSNTSECKECSDGYYLLNSLCVPKCPSGMTQKPTGKVCETCSNFCKECLGLSIKCTECDPSGSNPYLDGVNCVSDCGTGKYEKNGKCLPCDSSCLTCKSEATSCQSCLSTGNKPFLEGTSCVDSCGVGKFSKNGECFPCSSDCYQCEKEEGICTACKNTGKTLKDGYTCVESCGQGKYEVNGQCLPCDSPCLTCEKKANQCTSCEKGATPYLYENNCLNGCGDGKFSKNGECFVCSSPCSTCQENSEHCNSCISDSYIYDDSTHTCNSKCKKGEFSIGSSCSLCESNCETCEGLANKCKTCEQGKFLKGTQCVTFEQCTKSHSFVIGSDCQECSSSCKTCENQAKECTSCLEPDYLLKEKSCIPCPSLTHVKHNGSCQPCESPCLNCSQDPTQCSSCIDKFHLYEKKCYSKCPNGAYLLKGDSDLSECRSCNNKCGRCVDSETNCIGCEGTGMFLERNQCVKTCPKGKFGNEATSKCESCQGLCNECSSSANFCTICKGEFILEKNTGKCGCEKGTFLEGTTCKKCGEGCKECSETAEKCSSCLEGYLHDDKKNICVKESELEQCPSRCSICKLIEKICKVKLNFFLKLSEYIYDEYDIVLEVTLKENKEGALKLEKLKKLEINSKAIAFSIKEIKNSKIESKIFWDKEGRLCIGLTLPEDMDPSKKYTLEAKPSTTLAEDINTKEGNRRQRLIQETSSDSFKNEYILTSSINGKENEDTSKDESESNNQLEAQNITFNPPVKVTPEEKQTAKAASGTVSESMTYATGPTEYISFVSVVFTADPSGVTLKFSQISKLISRLRLINVQFGELLGTFMDGMSKGYAEKNVNLDKSYLNSNGNKAKIDFYGMRIFLFETDSFFKDGLKIFFYLISWMLKFIAWRMVKNFKKTKKIGKYQVKFIQFQRKIHFVLFNITIIDVAYYGTRSLIHTEANQSNSFNLLLIALCYSLYAWDLMDLAWVSSRARFRKTEYIEKNGEEKKFEKKEEIDGEEEKEMDDSQIMNLNPQGLSLMANWNDINKVYFEEDVVEEGQETDGKITVEKLEKLGYSKVIDYKGTMENILYDEVKEKHATSQLKENLDLYKVTTVLLANFFFLLRVVLYHVILVSLPFNPGFQTFLLLMLELGYLGIIVKNYIKHKFLNMAHTFISKVLQSVFLLIFIIVCLIINFGFRETPVSITYQKIGMYSVLVAVFFEYFFLVYNIIFIVVVLIKNRKKKKKKSSDIVYKWILDLSSKKRKEKRRERRKEKKKGNSVRPRASLPFEGKKKEKKEQKQEKKQAKKEIKDLGFGYIDPSSKKGKKPFKSDFFRKIDEKSKDKDRKKGKMSGKERLEDGGIIDKNKPTKMNRAFPLRDKMNRRKRRKKPSSKWRKKKNFD